MTSLSARVVSAVLTLVLSGTPAVLAACAALCLPGTSHEAAAVVAAPAVVAPADGSHGPAGHAHHHATTTAAAVTAPASPAPSRWALGGTDSHACCPDTVTAPAESAAIVRADAHSAPALVPVPHAMSRGAWLVLNAHAHHAVTGAPPPPRPPLVLRI